MASYTPDRFDRIPDDLARVGAHRGPKVRGRGWIAFAWAALATGLLVVLGLFALSRFDPRFTIEFPFAGGGPQAGQTAGPGEAEVTPITDPGSVDPALGVTISVFNGGPFDDVQDEVGTQLTDAGWTVAGTANASEREEPETVVYYRSSEYEGVALGMVETLGVGSIRLSESFPGAPVTIVLGEDYPPGG